MLELEESRFLGMTKRKFQMGPVIITDVEYYEPVSEDWHFHQNLHVSLYLQGGNNEVRKRKRVEALPGKIILYNKHELHRNVDTKEPTKILNIEFREDFFSDCELEFSSFSKEFIIDADIKFAILKAYHECMIDDFYSEDSISLSLLCLFEERNNQHRLNGKGNSWLNTLEEILRDRWDEFISLRELSGELKVHPVTISKYFPKHFNCTLGEYMRKIKVEKAMELLKKSHSSLSEISNICGFSDQSHFIRTFKNFTGFNPGGYKRL